MLVTSTFTRVQILSNLGTTGGARIIVSVIFFLTIKERSNELYTITGLI